MTNGEIHRSADTHGGQVHYAEAGEGDSSRHSIGVHDIGGLHCFGPIPMGDDSQPPFPEGWEGRTVGALVGAMMRGLFNVDEFRAGIEGMGPVAYMRAGYYEKWLHTLEYNLARSGSLTGEEIDLRMEEFARDPQRPLPDRRDDGVLAEMESLIEHGAPLVQKIEAEPSFAVGDLVRTREIEVERRGFEHTRLPGYAQGKQGRVEIVHPAMALPDASAIREDERAEYLYAVRFQAEDLWPDAEPGTSACVDLWESYLEPAGKIGGIA